MLVFFFFYYLQGFSLLNSLKYVSTRKKNLFKDKHSGDLWPRGELRELLRCGTVENKVLLCSRTLQGALERLFTPRLPPAEQNHQWKTLDARSHGRFISKKHTFVGKAPVAVEKGAVLKCFYRAANGKKQPRQFCSVWQSKQNRNRKRSLCLLKSYLKVYLRGSPTAAILICQSSNKFCQVLTNTSIILTKYNCA